MHTNIEQRTWTTTQVAALCNIRTSIATRCMTIAKSAGVYRPTGIGLGARRYTACEVAAMYVDHTLRAATHPTCSLLDTTHEIRAVVDALEHGAQPDWLITGGGDRAHLLGH